jgi:hypothetical protein
LVAYQLVASSTSQAAVEKNRAQSCCVGAIALAVKVSISTCTTYITQNVQETHEKIIHQKFIVMNIPASSKMYPGAADS